MMEMSVDHSIYQHKKYIAFDASENTWEFFDTFQGAVDWLTEFDECDGITEAAIAGKNFIAEITHQSVCRPKSDSGSPNYDYIQEDYEDYELVEVDVIINRSTTQQRSSYTHEYKRIDR